MRSLSKGLGILSCAVAFAAGSTLFTRTSLAATGTFGSGIELTKNGGTPVLYALDDTGTTRLQPVITGDVSTAPTLDQTDWANGTEASPVLNLGSFDPAYGQTLVLDGGALLTFKNGGDNVSAATLNYRIFPGVGSPTGSFININLPFNQDNVGGTTGDQRWAEGNLTTNLLTGLKPGTYTLGVYLNGTTTDPSSNDFSSNGGANYGAEFIVLPEPALIGLLGLGALAIFGRRKRA